MNEVSKRKNRENPPSRMMGHTPSEAMTRLEDEMYMAWRVAGWGDVKYHRTLMPVLRRHVPLFCFPPLLALTAAVSLQVQIRGRGACGSISGARAES